MKLAAVWFVCTCCLSRFGHLKFCVSLCVCDIVGAIASIAFNVCAPLVDGNVVRVFSRLRAIAADAKGKPLAKHCW